jgi:hypothetical protein
MGDEALWRRWFCFRLFRGVSETLDARFNAEREGEGKWKWKWKGNGNGKADITDL